MKDQRSKSSVEPDRRLAAIMYADAKGYSRLMIEDEQATIDAVNDHFQALISPTIANHGGRVIRTMGDGMLAEFGSIVAAVRCGMDIQQAMIGRNADVERERRIEFRIGINVGDVVIEQSGNLLGGDVNVAARLESLAEPGALCVSRAVYDLVKNKLALRCDYAGKRVLKNIPDPVEIFRISPEMPGAESAHETKQSRERYLLPDKPSIAVLPLTNMSGDERLRFFCDGMTEALIANLSRFHELFVIGRHSVFAAASKSATTEEIAEELGVRYVVEGSFLKADAKIRVTIQLIDAVSGFHRWAEQYTRDFEDVFRVQDEITQLIVGVLPIQVEEAERSRIRGDETSDLEAYGYLLRGQEYDREFTKWGNEKARQLYEKAIEIDPNYARAYSALSRVFNLQHRYTWTDDPDKTLNLALEHAQLSVKLDSSDPRGYSELGSVHLYMKHVDTAIEYFEKARQLNPNDADIIAGLAEAYLYAGRADQAYEQLEVAMRLNPYPPDHYLWKLADVHFGRRDYEAVIRTTHKMSNPSEGDRLAAASAAYLGRIDEAKMYANEVLRKHPNFSIAGWVKNQPDTDVTETKHLEEGLRMAGLPE